LVRVGQVTGLPVMDLTYKKTGDINIRGQKGFLFKGKK
jgi:hypothetical protein